MIPFENAPYGSVRFEEPLSASKGLPTPLEDFGVMEVQNDVVGTMDQKRSMGTERPWLVWLQREPIRGPIGGPAAIKILI